MADIEWELDDGIALVTLNRPEKANAFTLAMVDDWAAMYRRAAQDAQVRAVVLTARGSAFCGGIDLSGPEAAERSPLERYRVLTERIHAVAHAAAALDKPLIAAVNGAAMGAGMDMALMCDIRTASLEAKFAETYVRLGLVPGDGGTFLLPRIVGQARALELLLSGDAIDAEDAYRLGIVSHVFSPADLLERTVGLARRLVAGPPELTRMIVRAVRRSPREDMGDAFRTLAAESALMASTEDAHEALNARAEGRPPRFTGR